MQNTACNNMLYKVLYRQKNSLLNLIQEYFMCIKIMKTIEQQKQQQDVCSIPNAVKQDQNSQNLSLTLSNTSGYQSSLEEGRKGRYYASFSFTFKRKASVDISSYLSDGQQVRMDEFFDDDIIFQKKVQKRQIQFRPGCLSSNFINISSELIYKYCQQANEKTFSTLLESMSTLEIPIFDQKNQNEEKYTINQALEDLFYRKQHMYLIYTFDWSLCHLSFVCCLLIYWLQIQIGTSIDETLQSNKNKQQYIHQEKIKLKQNVCNIALYYTQQRSQQINSQQPVLLIIYQFLNFMKRQPCLDIVQISRAQDRLISDIKLYRRIKRKENQFQQPNNQIIIKSQLRKYEYQNKFITSQQKTQTLINLICTHNFVSYPLIKYYQLDENKNSRSQYQTKKDVFCLWMLNIIINQSGRKNIDSLHNAAMYILVFMSILKKMKMQSNLQGMSYLVPVLANIQTYAPKIWKYARQRRPQIQQKLTQYITKLTKKQFKKQQLPSNSSIIWNQTIYQMSQKMRKFLSTQQYIQLEQHKKFYQQFLLHFLHFRRNAKKQYKQQIQKFDKQKQIGSSFNMYLLDRYVPKQYEGRNMEDEWKKFNTRAENANRNISTSVYYNVINYCFVGSTAKFKNIDI